MRAAGREEADIVVVIVTKSRDAFVKAGYDMVNAFRICLEYVGVTLLVTEEQVPACTGLFTRTLVADEHVAKHLFLCAPFPRLHVFSLVVPGIREAESFTTLGGEPIADGDLILPALTVGPASGLLGGNRLFKGAQAPGKFAPLMLRDCPGERVIPATPGFRGVSVVCSSNFLCKLLEELLSQISPASDDYMALEAVSNVTDFCSELKQYGSVEAGLDE